MAGLMQVGMTLLLILIVIAFLACCGIPLLCGVFDKTVHSLFDYCICVLFFCLLFKESTK